VVTVWTLTRFALTAAAFAVCAPGSAAVLPLQRKVRPNGRCCRSRAHFSCGFVRLKHGLERVNQQPAQRANQEHAPAA
jgi:hypothetical protein